MKPGDLERTLARLTEVARAAQLHLDAVERELAALSRAVTASPAGPRTEGEKAPGAAERADEPALGEVVFK